MKKASELKEKLTKYGTRKLEHMKELIDLADEDIKDTLRPIMKKVVEESKKREGKIEEGVSKLINIYERVYNRTRQQIQTAKIIGDRNDEAAKKALHAIDDNVINGLKQHGHDKGFNRHSLKETQRITAEIESKICHQFHSSEKKEVHIIKKADKLLEKMKHKTRKMFNEFRREQKRAYRKLFRKASKKMIQILFNHNDPDNY